MTFLEQAIRDAIDKGEWDDTDYAFGSDRPEHSLARVDGWEYDKSFLLDPAFWQALGKARGWGTKLTHGGREVPEPTPGQEHQVIFGWLYHWHRLIDHLASGKDVESFFESLTK